LLDTWNVDLFGGSENWDYAGVLKNAEMQKETVPTGTASSRSFDNLWSRRSELTVVDCAIPKLLGRRSFCAIFFPLDCP